MKIKLKKDIDFGRFLDRIRECQGEVTFHTEQGDVLNLKSLLSTYVFSILADRPDLMERGWLTCESTQDLTLLESFVCQDDYLLNP